VATEAHTELPLQHGQLLKTVSETAPSLYTYLKSKTTSYHKWWESLRVTVIKLRINIPETVYLPIFENIAKTPDLNNLIFSSDEVRVIVQITIYADVYFERLTQMQAKVQQEQVERFQLSQPQQMPGYSPPDRRGMYTPGYRDRFNPPPIHSGGYGENYGPTGQGMGTMHGYQNRIRQGAPTQGQQLLNQGFAWTPLDNQGQINPTNGQEMRSSSLDNLAAEFMESRKDANPNRVFIGDHTDTAPQKPPHKKTEISPEIRTHLIQEYAKEKLGWEGNPFQWDGNLANKYETTVNMFKTEKVKITNFIDGIVQITKENKEAWLKLQELARVHLDKAWLDLPLPGKYGGEGHHVPIVEYIPKFNYDLDKLFIRLDPIWIKKAIYQTYSERDQAPDVWDQRYIYSARAFIYFYRFIDSLVEKRAALPGTEEVNPPFIVRIMQHYLQIHASKSGAFSKHEFRAFLNKNFSNMICATMFQYQLWIHCRDQGIISTSGGENLIPNAETFYQFMKYYGFKAFKQVKNTRAARNIVSRYIFQFQHFGRTLIPDYRSLAIYLTALKDTPSVFRNAYKFLFKRTKMYRVDYNDGNGLEWRSQVAKDTKVMPSMLLTQYTQKILGAIRELVGDHRIRHVSKAIRKLQKYIEHENFLKLWDNNKSTRADGSRPRRTFGRQTQSAALPAGFFTEEDDFLAIQIGRNTMMELQVPDPLNPIGSVQDPIPNLQNVESQMNSDMLNAQAKAKIQAVLKNFEGKKAAATDPINGSNQPTQRITPAQPAAAQAAEEPPPAPAPDLRRNASEALQNAHTAPNGDAPNADASLDNQEKKEKGPEKPKDI
jgi:hypothetical protein